MQLLPDAGLVPVAQTPPAGHAGAEAELLRQPLPSNPGGEHEQDPVQHLAVVEWPAAGIAVAPGPWWEERPDQLPQLVVNQAWRHHRPPSPVSAHLSGLGS